MKPRKDKTDLDVLQGAWSIAALEVDGESLPQFMLTEGSIEVKGDRFRSVGMGAVYEGTLTLDSGAAPKTFDLVFTSGPEKGNINRGIYEIAGDQWKLCLATRGDARPQKFATKSNTGHALQTLQRGPAKAPTAGKAEPASKSPTELEGDWSMVSGFMNGQPMDPMAVQFGVRSFRGNQTKLKFGPETYITATFSLDASTVPHAIDYSHTAGMFAGKNQLGIYECDGKTLKMSTSPPGSARPTNFAESGANTVTVFRKTK
jgi:uncharacterized protein (TIGR03067 family)